MNGEIVQGLSVPRLREVLTELMGSDSRELPPTLHEGEGGATPKDGASQMRSTG